LSFEFVPEHKFMRIKQLLLSECAKLMS